MSICPTSQKEGREPLFSFFLLLYRPIKGASLRQALQELGSTAEPGRSLCSSEFKIRRAFDDDVFSA
uniref:Uncharacterized protein n=1 Tax=Steinernema glaseri TaxID=37863 RepID=A0A1I7YBQ8_9BILA